MGSPAGGLRRHRKSMENFTAFRMDSNERQSDDIRESSLARGYDALGVELHNLDDGDDGELHHFASRNVQRIQPVSGGVSRISLGAKAERRVVNVGPGHAPFAAAMELGAPKVGLRGCGASRSASASAMSLDLNDDLSSSMSRKQVSHSQPRSTSMGVVRASKSRTSQSLPSLSSKSAKLLPVLATTKHRASDPLAWSMGASKSKWGGVGSVF